MLEVRNLDFEIGKKRILSDINLTISEKEFIVIVGPNGAGKSTLLKLISNELKPTRGTIHLQQKEVRKYTKNEIAKQRAVLTQNLHVSTDFKASEIVLMGRYPYFKENPSENDWNIIESISKQTGVTDLLNRNYNSLSGGEKQRIQLTRVFIQISSNEILGLKNNNNEFSKLLLLDEPLNNLDIKHQLSCLSLSKEFASRGNTVIAVLHDLNFASTIADKIILLNHGEIVAFGTPNEVLTVDNIHKCYDVKSKVEKHPLLNCPYVSYSHELEELILN